MQVTATLAAAVLATTALAGGVAGAAIHAATATVRVECPMPAAAPANDDAALRRFLAPPAPTATGGARY
jgi:hypothetical protein